MLRGATPNIFTPLAPGPYGPDTRNFHSTSAFDVLCDFHYRDPSKTGTELLVPATRVIALFRASFPRRFLASLPFCPFATRGAFRVILHRSVYCSPHEFSNFCIEMFSTSDLFVDGFRLLRNHHFIRMVRLKSILLRSARTFIVSRQAVNPSCTELGKNISKYSVVEDLHILYSSISMQKPKFCGGGRRIYAL